MSWTRSLVAVVLAVPWSPVRKRIGWAFAGISAATSHETSTTDDDDIVPDPVRHCSGSQPATLDHDATDEEDVRDRSVHAGVHKARGQIPHGLSARTMTCDPGSEDLPRSRRQVCDTVTASSPGVGGGGSGAGCPAIVHIVRSGWPGHATAYQFTVPASSWASVGAPGWSQS